MNKKFQFDIATSDPSCCFSVGVFVNDNLIWNNAHITDTQTVVYEFDDQPHHEHVVTVDISGKTANDTHINDQGNITKDALLFINNVFLMDVDITETFKQQVAYYHDFNGSADPIKDEYFGSAGCNGKIEFKFTTPSYIWLLENIS